MLCQQHWELVPSSFFIISLFWGSLFKKPQPTFPFWGVLKGWSLVFLFPKVSRLYFLDLYFGCFPFFHFSQVGWFLLARLKNPQPFSFMVLLPRFLKVPSPYSWVVGSQALWSLFYILGWLIRTYMFLFWVSWHAPLTCLNLILALLHVPRILGSWESLGILAQFFS